MCDASAVLQVVAGFAENQQYGLGTNSMTGEQKSLLIYGALAVFFILFLGGGCDVLTKPHRAKQHITYVLFSVRSQHTFRALHVVRGFS